MNYFFFSHSSKALSRDCEPKKKEDFVGMNLLRRENLWTHDVNIATNRGLMSTLMAHIFSFRHIGFEYYIYQVVI